MSDTKRKAHPLADPAHFSEGFHTAFRKGLDSPVGSHLHALVEAMPNGVYGSFAKHASAAIGDAGGAFDAGILRAACLSWNPDTAFPRSSPKLPPARTLRTGLRLLSHLEWAQVSGFLDHDPSRVAGPEAEGALDRNGADWASLNLDVMGAAVSVDVVSNQDGDHVIGAIRPTYGAGEPDAEGRRRRRIVVGWVPSLHGMPRIETPTRDGFPTFEEAFEACRAEMPLLGKRQRLYNESRLRGGDPEWAEAHGPGIERLCRHIATITAPGSMEGHAVRRMLWGPEEAHEAYRAARPDTKFAAPRHGKVDAEPLAVRLERHVRDCLREHRADTPIGFLSCVVLVGEEAARRRLRSVAGDRIPYGWGALRGPDELMEAWNAPGGMPPGPHPVPADGDSPIPA
jgi:hypothetical protein